MKQIVYCGIDSHKDFLEIGLNKESEPISEVTTRKIVNERIIVGRYFRRLKKQYEIETCYEAGPCGYTLYRQLKGMGIKCEVIAPTLIPEKRGKKVKNDKLDAKKLTRLYRGGYLTSIKVPNEKEEIDRNLIRQRDQYSKKIKCVKQQIGKYLLYLGIRCPYKSNWTQQYMKWLNQIVKERDSSSRYQIENYLNELTFLEIIQKGIDTKIEELSSTEEYSEQVGILKCFKGIGTYTAMALITNVIDFVRFVQAKHFMSYLGLTSGEETSGDHTKLKGITKTGNKLLRRLLIEASKHYQYPARISKRLKKQWEGKTEEVKLRSHLAMLRLNKKYHKILYKKGANKASTAVARELSGFIWAAMNNIPLRQKQKV